MKTGFFKTAQSLLVLMACVSAVFGADHEVTSILKGSERFIWRVTDAQVRLVPRWDPFSMPPPLPLPAILEKAEAKIRSAYGNDVWRLQRIQIRRFTVGRWAYIVTYLRNSVPETSSRNENVQFVAVVLPDGTTADPESEKK